MLCTAPVREVKAGYKPYQKDSELPLWGSSIAGSDDHARMLADWVTDHQSKGWSAIQVYVEAQKAGWHLEAFGDNLDEDVKQALIERGLLPDQVANNKLEAPMRGAQDTQSPPVTAPVEPPVSLDDIIKNMQENAK